MSVTHKDDLLCLKASLTVQSYIQGDFFSRFVLREKKTLQKTKQTNNKKKTATVCVGGGGCPVFGHKKNQGIVTQTGRSAC